MLEQLILGIIQGVAEWLPVSSEGMILIAKDLLFNSQDSFADSVKNALWLHFGTFLAALVYFRKDVKELLLALFSYKTQPVEEKNLINFLIITTLISGVLGLSLLKGVDHLSSQFDPNGRPVTFLIGLLLLGTGFLELRAKKHGYRGLKDINVKDILILGITQGFAALPGFSRSGLTVSFLLLRKFDKEQSLRLSFLMSMPLVLGGNILLHLNDLSFTEYAWAGLTTSFIFGYATIHLLLKVARKVNFGLFVIGFGLLTLLAAFIA